jgi:hypothetical protein
MAPGACGRGGSSPNDWQETEMKESGTR